MTDPLSKLKRTKDPADVSPDTLKRIMRNDPEGESPFVSPFTYVHEYIELFPKLADQLRFWMLELGGPLTVQNSQKGQLARVIAPHTSYTLELNVAISSYASSLKAIRKYQSSKSFYVAMSECQEKLGCSGPNIVHAIDSGGLGAIHRSNYFWHPILGFVVKDRNDKFNVEFSDDLDGAFSFIAESTERAWEEMNNRIHPFLSALGSFRDR